MALAGHALSLRLGPATKSELRGTNTQWTAALKATMFGACDAAKDCCDFHEGVPLLSFQSGVDKSWINSSIKRI
jgi:hypothetical protein